MVNTSTFGFIWKEGKSWLAEICQWPDGGGFQRSERFTSKVDAKRWLAQQGATPHNY